MRNLKIYNNRNGDTHAQFPNPGKKKQSPAQPGDKCRLRGGPAKLGFAAMTRWWYMKLLNPP